MTSPLELPPEEMRRLGYRVIDRIVDHLETIDSQPPVVVGDAEALRAALGGAAPDAPGDPDAALDRLFDEVLPWTSRSIHPRFFARIGSPSNFVSTLADTVASGFNLLGTSWVAASGPSTVEVTVVDWLRSWCGMPGGTEGLLVSGGSMASLTALVAARESRGGVGRRGVPVRPGARVDPARPEGDGGAGGAGAAVRRVVPAAGGVPSPPRSLPTARRV